MLFRSDIQEILKNQGKDVYFENYIDKQTRFLCQSAWFSKSIDCQNLIGKTAVVFGDSTHVVGLTKILTQEMGVEVILAGTYCQFDEEWLRAQLKGLCDNILITSDQNLVAQKISDLQPSAIFGTQMERHIGKRLNIPCGVISAPVHIQNYPLGYKPFFGYEGANQIADLIYNSFTLGMEDHLLEFFGGHDTKELIQVENSENKVVWSKEAIKQLNQIPGFVRQKIKKKVELFASDNSISYITTDVIYLVKDLV